MRRITSIIVLVVVVLLSAGFAPEAGAEVNVNVGIFAPPAYVFHEPPPVVVIPGSYVYIVPDVDVIVLFHHGHWWRHHDGRWFRGRGHNGPWKYMKHEHVPRAIRSLPPDYHRHRHVSNGHHRIPHGQYKKHWKQWERDKHWEKDERWREGKKHRDNDRRGNRDDRGKHRDDDRGKHRDDDRRGDRDDHRGRGRGGDR